MERKTLVRIIVGIILLALIAGFLYFKLAPLPSPKIKLTEDKLITNQTFINMIVRDMKSPLGNNLTKMVLRDDKSERNILDGVYEVAYYTCSNDEHQGWIYYNNGKISKLYGPYGWCYI